jgi:hypothetical protein
VSELNRRQQVKRDEPRENLSLCTSPDSLTTARRRTAPSRTGESIFRSARPTQRRPQKDSTRGSLSSSFHPGLLLSPVSPQLRPPQLVLSLPLGLTPPAAFRCPLRAPPSVPQAVLPRPGAADLTQLLASASLSLPSTPPLARMSKFHHVQLSGPGIFDFP